MLRKLNEPLESQIPKPAQCSVNPISHNTKPDKPGFGCHLAFMAVCSAVAPWQLNLGQLNWFVRFLGFVLKRFGFSGVQSLGRHKLHAWHACATGMPWASHLFTHRRKRTWRICRLSRGGRDTRQRHPFLLYTGEFILAFLSSGWGKVSLLQENSSIGAQPASSATCCRNKT